MDSAEYVAAVRRYLDDIASMDSPYFPLSFAPRDPISREAVTTSRPTLTDLAAIHPKTAIIGAPGAGKTRALTDLTKILSFNFQRDQRATLPIYVPLRYLSSPIEHTSHWTTFCISALNYILIDRGFSFSTPAELASLVRGRSCVLLLDGLNEISGREVHGLRSALDRLPSGMHVVVTSRIREYPPDPLDYAVYGIQPLSYPDDVRGFLKAVSGQTPSMTVAQRRVIEACERDRVIRQLATNPYLLSKLLDVATISPELPSDRASLLDAVVTNAIRDGHMQSDTVREFLCLLGREMQFDAAVLRISVSSIRTHKTVDGDHDRLVDLLNRLINARILVRSNTTRVNLQRDVQNDDDIGFHHQVIQEFFAGLDLFANSLKKLPTQHCKRTLRKHAGSRWNWESISTAMNLLVRHDATRAFELLRWLAKHFPPLAALVLSEMPDESELNAARQQISNRLVRRFERDIKAWALWLPHCYIWLPALVIGASAVPLWFYGHNRVDKSALGLSIPAAIVPASLLLISVCTGYVLLLLLVYWYLDDRVFDRFVSPSLTSLELLHLSGSHNVLRDLRRRALINPFISERMKSWILSTPVVRLADVRDSVSVLSLRGLPHIREDVTSEWVDKVLGRLNAPATDDVERLQLIDALGAALKILGSDDALHIAIVATLTRSLEETRNGRIRKRLIAVLGSKAVAGKMATLLTHWRHLLAIWVFAGGLVIFGAAIYWRLSPVIGAFGVVVTLISTFNNITTLLRTLRFQEDR